jgi:hypothetical protein
MFDRESDKAPEAVGVEEHKRVVRELIIQKLNAYSEVEYVADARWVVSFVRQVVAHWCEDHKRTFHEAPLQHVAPSRDGLAPKYRMRITTRMLPPPPTVNYYLDDMPGKAIPPGSIVTVEVTDVDEIDDGDLSVRLRFRDYS